MSSIAVHRDGGLVSSFFKRNIVFVVATVAAVCSCILVPPDAEYLEYFDLKTLISLFCMLAVISALRNIMFFRILAHKLICIGKNTRVTVLLLVFITYFASMLIANDMALLTFLPLGFYALTSTKNEKYMAFTFTMQTIAANLGGMLTPFGNPQNLYLYNAFHIPTGEFFKIMALPFILSLVMICCACMIVKKEQLVYESPSCPSLNKGKAILYFVMFAYSLLIVFRIVPYWTGLFIVPIMYCADKKALTNVDYVLLLTFCMFFVFSGNMARIPTVQTFFCGLLDKSVLLTGVFCSQIISNVPTAILLSGFTDNYSALLVAVNIGGCGTLIASLASLITFKEFSKNQPHKTIKYLITSHLTNFAFLLVLVFICSFKY